MNGTHLRSKLFELLSIILFWFYPYLREFLECTGNDRFLCQLLTILSGNWDESFKSHDSLLRDPGARTTSRSPHRISSSHNVTPNAVDGFTRRPPGSGRRRRPAPARAPGRSPTGPAH